jgi:hypothetical protein
MGYCGARQRADCDSCGFPTTRTRVGRRASDAMPGPLDGRHANRWSLLADAFREGCYQGGTRDNAHFAEQESRAMHLKWPGGVVTLDQAEALRTLAKLRRLTDVLVSPPVPAMGRGRRCCAVRPGRLDAPAGHWRTDGSQRIWNGQAVVVVSSILPWMFVVIRWRGQRWRRRGLMVPGNPGRGCSGDAGRRGGSSSSTETADPDKDKRMLKEKLARVTPSASPFSPCWSDPLRRAPARPGRAPCSTSTTS